ncbi:MAG: UPF0149 family protein [Desulfovibrionaceae bacterium]|nr:UPF0149 family protein [Desulfovibrionaceae bacterium]
MSLPNYLSDEEYDLLDEFLSSRTEAAGGIPGVSWLDGYLAAVILSPEQIPEEEWLPLVWSDDEDEQPSFNNDREAAMMKALVVRHHKALEQCIANSPLEFNPILLEDPDNPELPDLGEWAAGFMDGLALRHELWQKLIDSPDQQLLLMPIFLYGTDAGTEELINDPELDDPLLMAEELPHTIEAIRKFWENQQR